jgi:putative acetyltransferase
MQVTIRPIEQTDNRELANIIRTALAELGANKPGTVFFDPTTDHLYELFRQEGSAYFVAISDSGELLGGCGIFPTEGLPAGCCELVKMYLSGAARGRGLGRQLIDFALEKARSLGYRQVYLETMPELRQAVSVYEKFGFSYLPGPLGNSGHFGCDVWMIRDL